MGGHIFGFRETRMNFRAARKGAGCSREDERIAFQVPYKIGNGPGLLYQNLRAAILKILEFYITNEEVME